MLDPEFWHGSSVFLTGHTGFKGAWLAHLLQKHGANVTGYALAPPTTPSAYELLSLTQRLAGEHIADIRDLDTLTNAMSNARPKVVFHLAAQPLVRLSYDQPCETLASNISGTAHVLEAARHVDSAAAIVIVTTDKCYENVGWTFPYRENDRLGGADPYSASKAAAEIVTASYRQSFFSGSDSANVATARAGNVIGGGDWADDRIIPDCIRAFNAGDPVVLRNPAAIRPWQHVLDPLFGYVRLAEELAGPHGPTRADSWNFGPEPGGEATVETVARAIAQLWGQDAKINMGKPDPARAESAILRLDITKARVQLGWQPVWTFERSLEATVEWYRCWRDKGDLISLTNHQIEDYETACTSRAQR